MGETQKRRIQFVGSVGTGKTFLFASMLSVVAHERKYTYSGDNEAALAQMQLAVMGGRPRRTPEEDSERFEFYGSGNTYELFGTPGEWISRSDTAETISLQDVIRAVRNDCCVLTINPFKCHKEFGHLVFVAFVAELQRKMSEMSFGDACRTAAITMFDLIWENFDEMLGDVRWSKLFSDGGMHEQVLIKSVATATLDDVNKDDLGSCYELSRRDGAKITDNDRRMILKFLGEPARVSYLDSGRSNLRLMRLSQELNYEPIYFLSRMDVYGLVRHQLAIDFVSVYSRLFEGVPVSFSNIWNQPIATPEIFAVIPESHGRMRANLDQALAAPLFHRIIDLADLRSPRSLARNSMLETMEKQLKHREKELAAWEADLRKLSEQRLESAPAPHDANWEQELKDRDARLEAIESEMEGHLAQKYEEGRMDNFARRTLPISILLFLWLLGTWVWYQFSIYLKVWPEP